MAELIDRMREEIGTRYRIERELASGGSATVYVATDLKHERTVALKVLHPKLTEAVGEDRFLREIEFAAHLQHPNIVPLYDSGTAAGSLYYVMPLIEGESLRERMLRESQLPLEDALRITREIADALAYAHEQGLVHRDIKPGNILLSHEHAMVSDFGIARAEAEAKDDTLTAPGLAVGTPAYMSPEQASGSAEVDGRSDIYSLGCVLFEMLAGEPPFSGRTPQAVIARHLAEAPPSVEVVRPDLPLGIAQAVTRSLAKSPADRYATPFDFAAALEAPVAPPRRRGPARIATLAATSIVAATLLGFLLVRLLSPPPPALAANRVLAFPLAERGLDEDGAGAGLDAALLIITALEYAGPLKAIGVWGRLTDAERADIGGMTADRQREVALARHAAYYIGGAAMLDADSARLVLELHAVDGDSLVAQRSVSRPAGAYSFVDMALEAIRELLPFLVDPELARRVQLAGLQERHPSAIALWLQGERFYRILQTETALALFEGAVATDSAFAFAAMRGAQAAAWEHDYARARRLSGLAVAYDSLLPPRYADFVHGLRAYLAGDARAARARLEQAVAQDPEWPAALSALGETYFHLQPAWTNLDSAAAFYFTRAVEADSLYVAPLMHLAELAAQRGDAETAERHVRTLAAYGAPEKRLRQATLMAECVGSGAGAMRWDGQARDMPEDVLAAGLALAAGGRNPPCAAGAFEALLAREEAPQNVRWGAFVALQGLAVATGESGRARALLDSALAVDPWAWEQALYVIDGEAGAPMPEGAARMDSLIRSATSDEYSGLEAPQTRWVLGMWNLRTGRTDRALILRDALAADAEDAGSEWCRRCDLFARSLNAHLLLAGGDSATALEAFERLVPTAPYDTLLWAFAEPLPVGRLEHAELLLATGRAEEAIEVATVFDGRPVVYLPFVPASLDLRLRAATLLRQPRLQEEYRDRLATLGSDLPAGRPDRSP